MKKMFVRVVMLMCCVSLMSCKTSSTTSGIDASGLKVNYVKEFLPRNCQPITDIEAYKIAEKVYINPNFSGEAKVKLYTDNNKSYFPFFVLPENCEDPANLDEVDTDPKTPTIKMTDSFDVANSPFGASIEQKSTNFQKLNWCKAKDEFLMEDGVSYFSLYKERDICNKYIAEKAKKKQLTALAIEFFKKFNGRWVIVPPIGYYDKNGNYRQYNWTGMDEEGWTFTRLVSRTASEQFERVAYSWFDDPQYNERNVLCKDDCISPESTGLQLTFLKVKWDEKKQIPSAEVKAHTYRFKIQE